MSHNTRHHRRTPLAVVRLEDRTNPVLFGTPDYYDLPGNTSAVAAGDFDGDGDLDLAAGHSGGVTAFVNNGAGKMTSATTNGGGGDGTLLVIDVTGDGRPDILAGSPIGQFVAVFVGKGDGTFHGAVFRHVGSTVQSLTAADFDGDGKRDLAIINALGAAVMLNDGSPTVFGSPVFHPTGGATDGIGINSADFNGDGKPDLVTTGWSSNRLNVQLNAGGGDFVVGPTYFFGDFTRPTGVEVGDFNGDGRPDLAVGCAGINTVGLLLGNGDGTFREPTRFPAAYGSASQVTVADLDADGKLDLVMQTGEVMLGDGAGGLVTALRAAVAAGPTDVTAADFTGDGLPDLASSSSFSPGAAAVTPNTTPVVASFTVSAPAAATAGEPFAVTLTARDQSGFVLAGYVGTARFTSTDPLAGLPADYTFTAADNGSKAFTVTLKTAGPQTVAAADEARPAATGSAAVAVAPADAAAFEVTGFPSPVTAGDAKTFAVTARDPFGNLATGYLGTVHFTNSDPQAGLPADYTFTAGDNGTRAFAATPKTAGTHSLTATDAVSAAVAGTQAGIAVTPAAAASFQLVGFQGTLTAGTVVDLTLTARDAFGNVATGYAGTVRLTSTDGQAVLPADYTFTTADAGARTFPVTLKTAGPQSVTAQDAANGLSQSAATAVTPAAAAFFTVGGFPAAVTAGEAKSLTVTARDPFGNVATGYAGTVRFASTDPQAALPADYTFSPGDNGTRAFAATLRTAGVRSLTAADTASASLAGGQSGIIVDPAAATAFALTGLPAVIPAGAAATFTVTARDAFGNVATGFAGVVHFIDTDAQATLPANYAFTAADQGQKAFAVTFRTAGDQTLTATPVGAGPAPATAGTTVAAAAPARLRVEGVPAVVAAGVENLFLANVEDEFGNLTDYSGPVTAGVTDPLGTVPSGHAFRGQFGSIVTYRTAGTWELTVSAPGLPTLSLSTAVSAGPVSRILVAGFPGPVLPGTTGTVTVSLFDRFGNPTAAPIGFSSTDPQADLPAASAVTGVGVFAVTLRAPGTHAITATDLSGASATGSQTGILVLQPPPPPPPPTFPDRQFAAGADRGGAPAVRFFDPDGAERLSFPAFDFAFSGGVRVAAADFNHDGVPDIVAGTGPGTATLVRVLDGVSRRELFVLAPFEPAFTGGVYVAAGDLTGDGRADLVITPDEGGGPRVRVFSGGGFAPVADFFGIEDPSFRGGARAAVGDVSGDGAGDLVVAAGFGGGPRIAVFDGRSVPGGSPARLFGDFFAFEPGLRNGAFVAAGDLDADGFADLVAGGGPGGGPRVLVLSGRELPAGRQEPLANFFAGDTENRGGARVAVKDLDGDLRADLVVGSGTGAGSLVTGYAGRAVSPDGVPPELFAFDAFPGFVGGVFVG